MRDIVYIHGFASSGCSSKGVFLHKHFPNVVRPNLESKPVADLASLSKIISDLKNPILVGSSLGGFYAEYLGIMFNLNILNINPLSSIQLIKGFIGEHTQCYNNKTFYFTESDYIKLLALNDEISNIEPQKERVILTSKKDELIDYRLTLKHYKYSKDVVNVYNIGDHPFNIEHIIINHIKGIIKSTV